jgi:undecaprenyl-diphosphatase
MWVATAVGDPWVVRSVAVLVIGLLFLVGKRAHALLLAGSVSSAAVLSALLKILFERPRPLPGFALIDLPGSFSFPSGHALSSLVFFGVLAFIGLRLQTATRQRFLIVSAALLAAGVIGISRVYLGVHWMTDVLGGWVLALAVLTAWIGAFVTWERYGRPPKDRAPLVRGAAAVWLSGAAVAIALVLIAWGALQDPILASATQPPALKPLPVTEVRGGPPFLTPEAVALLPRVTVNPDGSAAEPVGIVFIGEKEQLLRAFAQAGWSVADPGTLGNILHTAAASMSGSPYPTAPVTPSFLDGRAQDLAFEKPEGAVTVKRRHHTRLWLTGFTAEGRPVWVGTASFDSRFEIGSAIPLPTHHIEPDIDAERDFIVRDLTTAGGLKRTQIVRVSPAKAGRNAEGDLFFTGGEAAVLTR